MGGVGGAERRRCWRGAKRRRWRGAKRRRWGGAKRRRSGYGVHSYGSPGGHRNLRRVAGFNYSGPLVTRVHVSPKSINKSMAGSLQRLGVGYWRVLVAPVATGDTGNIRRELSSRACESLHSKPTPNPLSR